MRVLSLFSGIGGFDLGFERAGMTIVGMCEIDRHAQSVLRRRFPSATLHTDVRKVSYERGAVDVICGGFPCQDLSVAGKRRGLAGDRSGLWHEFARIIDEAEPAWVVIENVPGLFSSNAGRDFAVIVDWLAQRGYGVGWRVLDAQGFGLAQRRKRVFIVASFGTKRGCTVLLEPESVRWDTTTRRGERQGDTRAVAKCLTAHSGRADWETRNMTPTVYAIDSQSSNSWKSQNPNSGIHEEQIARTIDTTGTNPTANQGGNVIVPFAIQGNIVDRQRGSANGIGISQSNISYTLTAVDRHAVATTDISPTLRAEAKQSLMSGDGNINAPLAIGTLWESSHGYDPARVMPNQDIVPTLSAKMGTGENNVPLIGVRRLTPTECERLQGFPDGWTEGQSDAQRYKQLGNAVAVPVAEWIGHRILTAVLR
jgi:DNA (cytosine-5)-methyltransferase 1